MNINENKMIKRKIKGYIYKITYITATYCPILFLSFSLILMYKYIDHLDISPLGECTMGNCTIT